MANLEDSKIQVVSETNLEQLAEDIAFQSNHKATMDFIIRIDEQLCSLEFTVELYARLGDIIRAEYLGDPEQLSLLDFQDAITPE